MDTQKLDRAIEQLKAQERTGYGVEQFEVGIQAILGVRKAAKKLAYIHQCIDLYCDREELHDESYWLDYILDPEWIDTDIGWDGYEMKPTNPNQSEFPTRCDHTAEVSKKVCFTEEERRMLKKMRTLYNGTYADLLDRLVASALEDADSAYIEGYTYAESKYRKMWDEMQANIKEKAFGKRKGLIHTADIDAMPTIEPERQSGREVYQAGYAEGYKAGQEERKTGKWVGVKEYCDHLNEEAEREGKGNRYIPSGMNIHVYCNQCWGSNDRRTTYCPNCGARLVQEGEDNECE